MNFLWHIILSVFICMGGDVASLLELKMHSRILASTCGIWAVDCWRQTEWKQVDVSPP